MVIFGELLLFEGIIIVKGKIVYVLQQVWIYNGILCQNIFFGQDDEEDKFIEVIKVCVLDKVLIEDIVFLLLFCNIFYGLKRLVRIVKFYMKLQ